MDTGIDTDERVEALLQAWSAARPAGATSPHEALRAAYQTFFAMRPAPEDVITWSATVGRVPVLRCRPAGHIPGTVVLYVHGGGYVAGSAAAWRELAARLALASGAELVVADYRLMPEHGADAAVEDVLGCWRALAVPGHTVPQVAIAGDSAGAAIALRAVVALRDRGEPLPVAVACLSPWVDLTLSGRSHQTHRDLDPLLTTAALRGLAGLVAAGRDPADPEMSPLFADLSGLPPLLVQAGEREILLDDARRLAQRAVSAGVDVQLEVEPAMFHVWHQFAFGLTAGGAALARVGQFLRAHLGVASRRQESTR